MGVGPSRERETQSAIKIGLKTRQESSSFRNIVRNEWANAIQFIISMTFVTIKESNCRIYLKSKCLNAPKLMIYL